MTEQDTTSPIFVEIIPVEAEFQQHPEHFSWIGDLNAAWMVARHELDPAKVVWNACLSKTEKVALGDLYSSRVSPAGAGLPSLLVRAFCVSGGKNLSSHFGAPVLLHKERRGLDGLLGYEVKKKNGQPLDKAEYLEGVFRKLNLPNATPVYRAFFFLPVPLRGATYETHFFPLVNSGAHQASNLLVVENNLIGYGQISDLFSDRLLMDIDPSRTESYHKATFTPNAAAQGKIIVPSYEGRLIVISRPITVEKQIEPPVWTGPDFRESVFYSQTRGADSFSGAMGMKSFTPTLSKGGPVRSAAEVDTVSVGRGVASRNRSSLVNASNRDDILPTIYDIRCLGVRRGSEAMYTAEGIMQLFAEAYPVLKFKGIGF